MKRISRIFCLFASMTLFAYPASAPVIDGPIKGGTCQTDISEIDEVTGIFVDKDMRVVGNGTVVTSIGGRETENPIVISAAHVVNLFANGLFFIPGPGACNAKAFPLKWPTILSEEKDVSIVFFDGRYPEKGVNLDLHPAFPFGRMRVNGHVNASDDSKDFYSDYSGSVLYDRELSIKVLAGSSNESNKRVVALDLDLPHRSSGTGLIVRRGGELHLVGVIKRKANAKVGREDVDERGKTIKVSGQESFMIATNDFDETVETYYETGFRGGFQHRLSNFRKWVFK